MRVQAVTQMRASLLEAQQALQQHTVVASAARTRSKPDTLAFRVFHVMANQEAGVLQVLGGTVCRRCMQGRGAALTDKGC
jgi:hypothetical protein